jgi:hypothetical protein
MPLNAVWVIGPDDGDYLFAPILCLDRAMERSKESCFIE